MSKLANVSVKKLRHYDEIDLLKPVYVDKESKYRYYQFNKLITIDLIKHFRMMGFSLKAIKKMLNSTSSFEDMVKNIKSQSEIIGNKIKELTEIKTYLDGLDIEITESIDIGFDKCFFKYNKKRIFINYNIISSNVEELDSNLRNIILDLEENESNLYIMLGSTVSYEAYKRDNQILYTGVKIFEANLNNKYKNVLYLPEGNYLTIIYQGDIRDSSPYYKILFDYIKENDIQVIGEFNETWIIGKMDENLKEKTLIKIDILIK